MQRQSGSLNLLVLLLLPRIFGDNYLKKRLTRSNEAEHLCVLSDGLLDLEKRHPQKCPLMHRARKGLAKQPVPSLQSA